MSAPIPITVRRHKCPHCPKSYANKQPAVAHIGRCWYNPAARGCKTCKHFTYAFYDGGEACLVDVDLTGRPRCETCGGFGDALAGPGLGMTECPACSGNGAEVKAGPIVHCDLWEAQS